ncbi:oxysterol binding protein [Blastocystis sp. subtype 4]|uniref:oxysterol binding protein n=1 Tax=Blastocystis sp. subtype 4 TaxID=944170 RepID=UPI000711CDBA|nr:oxysterol binding protein [Blastocystis sp. subtype 4]KNB46102.1 oxysterol binding protein [Blastocystis sp. subtype 4]|eukprot:XP_014529545.1 oxysterol binding protein [Blastocystis sp. subtype 4]
MEDHKEIDYFAYAVPYKTLDITIISTRFPYSKERVESILASTHGSLSSQAISVWLTKPVSLLEECAFVLDYIHILTESKYESLNQENRFHVILRYLLACYATLPSSIYFPCIPYLGETFSCFVTCGSKRIQYIAEQCTIHPNTSAFYVEDDAKEFQIEGTLQPKYLFCGNSIRCMIHGSITIHHKCGDCYSLTFPSICISSLRHGSPEIQLCGKSCLTSNTNYSAGLEFIERSLLGGDARCVRVLVYEKDKIVYRLQGRWDIGYEILCDSSQSIKEFLSIQTLKANRRFVLRDDLQGPMESLQVWKTLRQEMIGGSDCDVSQRILIKSEMKKKQYQKQMESLSNYSPTDRLLFTQIDNQLEFRFKQKDQNLCFLEVSRNVDNGIKKAEDIHTLLNVYGVC